jgi:hypothetical protein
MTVIQADFAPPQPGFSYQQFRAEFVRRKKQSLYAQIVENADKLPKQLPLWTADGKPYWASVMLDPGISNIIHGWQRERYIDPDDGQIRYTQSVLDLVRHPMVEPYALEVIEQQAQLLKATDGRTYLTPDEYKLLNLSKKYLAEADQLDYRHKFYGFEPRYRSDGTLVEQFMYRWISSMTGYSVSYIEGLLITCENVYRMRAVLGYDSEPEVQVAPARQREASANIAA